MKTKNKIIIITLLAIYALIGSYIFITQIESVNPPETIEYSVIIDLEKPDVTIRIELLGNFIPSSVNDICEFLV